MTLYLDYNATTPIDERVLAEVVRCFSHDWANAGSGHDLGLRAKNVVHAARDQIACVVAAKRHDVVFTSGATESNNLAILGMAAHGRATGRRHIVSTQIEHKAVLEPLAVLSKQGFEVELVAPERSGSVSVDAIMAAVRPDTLLVSVMHVNNETGVIQPVSRLADHLENRDLVLHVDAAQGFGKELSQLRHPRIDLISISSHKIFGPVGVGSLIARHRRNCTIPLAPVMFGGGQELGLRPGTIPVPLVSGFGLAAELAEQECAARNQKCRDLRDQILAAIVPLGARIHGNAEATLPHTLNVSFPGVDGDRLVEELHGTAAIATGSACTTVCATGSHVLAAMGVSEENLESAVRLSWSHRVTSEELARALPAMSDVIRKLQ